MRGRAEQCSRSLNLLDGQSVLHAKDTREKVRWDYL